ncbi:MAG: glycoside hydrolase family 3 C-terminal domain-containing protein, partial [Erysipelotrichaceae bacterium]|nr:glycoside hydrolase family 3 C-terminal domain-containing protein [Erysipelotrichaceae bacterium]
YEVNPNVAVVLLTNYPYAINWMQEHVPAILTNATGSQDLGNGLAAAIFGDVNPAARVPMTWYLSTILTHGMTGLAMAVLLPGTNFMVMGIGSVLFMISDMVLTAYRFIFKNNKWLIRLNSLTYFTGLLLIVISTAL